MDVLNYVVLVVGLLLIGLFWNFLSPKERKKETRIVTICLFILGVVVYIVQSCVWPL